MNNLIYDSPSKKNTIFLPKSDKKSSSNKYVSETDTLAKLKCKDDSLYKPHNTYKTSSTLGIILTSIKPNDKEKKKNRIIKHLNESSLSIKTNDICKESSFLIENTQQLTMKR